MGNGQIVHREFSSVDRPDSGVSVLQFLQPIKKAADGKIPLSMVQVKRKPQYLVFEAHFAAYLFGTLDFGLWKALRANPDAVFVFTIALKSVQPGAASFLDPGPD